MDSVDVLATALAPKEKLGFVVLMAVELAIKALGVAELVAARVKAKGFVAVAVLLDVAMFPGAALAPNKPLMAGDALVADVLLLEAAADPNAPENCGVLFVFELVWPKVFPVGAANEN